jgi:hypothetical protein
MLNGDAHHSEVEGEPSLRIRPVALFSKNRSRERIPHGHFSSRLVLARHGQTVPPPRPHHRRGVGPRARVGRVRGLYFMRGFASKVLRPPEHSLDVGTLMIVRSKSFRFT